MDKRPYILILGSGESAKPLIKPSQQIRKTRYKLVGCLSLNGSRGFELTEGMPILGRSDTLRDYIFQNPVDVVFVSAPLSAALSEELLEPALEIGLTVAIPKGVAVSLKPTILKKLFVRCEPLFGINTTLLTTLPQRKGYLIGKRILDCMISASALLLLAPLFVLIALAIKLNSPRSPLLYRLHWLGKNGKPFVGYKFRTMVPDADRLKQQLLALNEMQGPVFKMRNDPRVTRLGRFLRRFSLDELPQLYSVLKGDLSLVGPRAPLKEEAEKFEFWQRRKLSVKPGITCLWQINGRNEIRDFSQWARLDLQYIHSASIPLDLKIMLKTIPAVLSGRGAS